MNLESVTVIIPAHNRPDKLRRLLHYYSGTNIRIVVSDSSDLAFPYLNEFPGLAYFHFPKATFLLKINLILPQLITKYVVYCADDDFIVPQAISQVVAFLDTNPDYSSAQGHYLSYSVKNNGINFYPAFIRNLQKDVNQNLPAERLKEYRNLYASTLYSVIRAKTFVEMYQHCLDGATPKFKNLFLAEIYFNFFALIDGKNKTLPVFYGAREKDYQSATYSTIPFSTIKTSPLYREEYQNFIGLLASQLASKEHMEPETAKDIISGILQEQKKVHIHPLKQTLLTILEKYGPSDLTKRLFSYKYKKKGLQITKGMQSFPSTFSTPEKDRIIDHIRKYA
jgi:glycosyltransferase domain-containing protein